MANAAFIGLGSMGGSMAQNLVGAGHRVTVYDVVEAKCDAINGAEKVASVAEAARNAEFIFLSVPDPAALKECIFGETGVLSVMREGQIVIDMSTVSIEVSAQCDQAVKVKGGFFLCTPIGGGTDMAKAKTITIMCSGPKDAYDAALPLFKDLSRAQYYLGECYGARAMKLAHNMMLAINMQMLAETLAFCEKAGVDPNVAMDIIGESMMYNKYLDFKLPEIRDRSFKRTSMPVKMLAKDMRLAMECVEQTGAEAPLTQVTKQMLDTLNEQGYGDQDPTWLLLQMERQNGMDPKEMHG